MLEASERNTRLEDTATQLIRDNSTHSQIRPYSRAGRRNARYRSNYVIEPIPMQSFDEIEEVQADEEGIYIRDLQEYRAARREMLRQAIERGEESRVVLLEDRDDLDEEQIYSEAISVNSIFIAKTNI
jgi:hypothetical protein